MESPGQGAGAVPHDQAHEPPNDAPNDAAAGKPTRGGARARPRATEIEIRQRVEYVLALYVSGRRPGEILRCVAKRHAAETEKRQLALEALEKGDVPPRVVWGLEDKPPADRTVATYLKAAKEELARRGRSVITNGDMLLGLQIARLGQAYQTAQKAKAAHAMVRVVEVTNDLFALEGVVRPPLTAAQAGGDGQGGDEEEPTTERRAVPDATMTEESAAQELARLLGKARQLYQLQQPPVAVIPTPGAP